MRGNGRRVAYFLTVRSIKVIGKPVLFHRLLRGMNQSSEVSEPSGVEWHARCGFGPIPGIHRDSSGLQ